MKKYISIILVVVLYASLSLGYIVQHRRNGSVGDGEIGDGGTFSGAGGALINFYYYETWQPTTAGNVRYLRLHGGDTDDVGTSDACLVLCNSSGTVLGSCTVQYSSTANSWKHCDMGSEIELQAATNYILGLAEINGDLEFSYGTQGTKTDYYNKGSAPSCGSDNITADNGDAGSKKPLLHANNVNQAAP